MKEKVCYFIYLSLTLSLILSLILTLSLSSLTSLSASLSISKEFESTEASFFSSKTMKQGRKKPNLAEIEFREKKFRCERLRELSLAKNSSLKVKKYFMALVVVLLAKLLTRVYSAELLLDKVDHKVNHSFS